MNNKIIFFTGAMGRGGAERVISFLSRYYAENGWSVQIAMLLHSNVDYALDSRIKLVDLSSEKGIRRGFLCVLGRIRAYLKAEQPKVCVVFMAQICLLVGLASFGLHTPLIMSERIDPSQIQRNYFYRKLLNYFYAHSKKTIMQTRRAMHYFPEKVQQNSTIIANPISVQALAVPGDGHRIVTAGRLEPQKNQRMLIEAFSACHIKYPEYRLDIYGEGPLKKELQLYIDELGLSGCVTLPGNVPNLHECISDAEMFVLPSNFEGLSNALLEAMMMGLPCISTDCAGSDEVIHTGRNGILVPVGDTQALSDAMLGLIEDETFRTKLGIAAKESAERFRLSNIITLWNEVIGEPDL